MINPGAKPPVFRCDLIDESPRSGSLTSEHLCEIFAIKMFLKSICQSDFLACPGCQLSNFHSFFLGAWEHLLKGWCYGLLGSFRAKPKAQSYIANTISAADLHFVTLLVISRPLVRWWFVAKRMHPKGPERPLGGLRLILSSTPDHRFGNRHRLGSFFQQELGLLH